MNSTSRGLLALLVGPLLVPAALADDTNPDALEQVTVFGSRVSDRSVFDSAVPIDYFSPAQVKQALVSGELGQALQDLSPAVNMPRASSSGTSDSVRAIQFRGLGPDEVLVLVNGKRRHANAVMDIEGLFPGTVAVDLNAIPEEAIDHIEILRDGAGALYGSDAVAGVVNIVLKGSSGGGQADVLYGANVTHFAPTDQRITDGRSKMISADYGFSVAGGFLHVGADYRDTGSTNRAGPTSASASYNSTPADLALDNRVLFQSGDPATINKSVFYNLSVPVGARSELYSYTTANYRDTWGGAFFRYPGDPTNVLSIYPNGYRPVSTGVSQDLDAVLGLKTEWVGWRWDFSAREGYNTFSYGLTNTLNASLGPDSPTRFHVADFTYEERGLNLDLTRELQIPGWSAPLGVSTGAEYMHEAYHTSPGDPASYAAGPYTVDPIYGEVIPPGSQGDNGLSPGDVAHLTRGVWSGYLGFDNEIASRLLLQVAGRYSHYSDYGDSVTGKFAVRYSITDSFLLRGSVSNSFRAPSLAQEAIRITTLNFNDTGTGLQNTAFLPPTDPLAAENGGIALRPEKSVNTTVGLAWRAPWGISTTLDLYQIRIRDRIVPTGQIPTFDPTYPNIAAVSFLTNGLDTTTRGLDLVVSQSTQVAGGSLKLSASFNRNYLHQDALRNALADNANVNAAVLIPLEYGSPSTKLILAADWSNARWGVTLQPIHYGTLYAFSYDSSLPVIQGANVQKYDPAWTVNAEAHLSIVDGIRVAVGGTDVFNRYPDRTTPGGSYYGALPYNFANPIGINGAFYYARLTVSFGPNGLGQ
ncbi:MAG: TonB-dependent receptor [Proteobacteria bacterium]|nr:TonB-dependent receptor [Pseudomonadota bacterium]